MPVARRLPEPVIAAVGVSRSFGRQRVLQDVDLAVRPGELVVVRGPSGAGKTTLLRLLHGQLRPTSGEIWIAGNGLHRRWRRGVGRARQQIGFVFQDHRLLPRLTAVENVIIALQVCDPAVPFRTIRELARASLEEVGLGDRMGAYPEQLSGGERQLVAIARAVAGGPRIVLADEPLASIDDDAAGQVVRLLTGLARTGAAVVVATHQPGFRADRVVSLPRFR